MSLEVSAPLSLTSLRWLVCFQCVLESSHVFSDVSSIIIIIIIRDKDVMLLQESGKTLADLSSHIQERYHHYCHTGQTKWRFFRLR